MCDQNLKVFFLSCFLFFRRRRLKPKPARRPSVSGWRGRNISRKKSRSGWRGRRWGVQKVTLEFSSTSSPPLSKLQPLTHWSLSDMRSVLRRSWRGLGKAMQEIRFVWFLLNRLESQLPLAFLEITNCFSFLLQNRRKMSKLLHKSTARTQSSVRVSATSYAIIYTVWKTSNHLICLLIIILQQRETCRVLTQQSSARHKVHPLLLWTASSPPLTRTASQPTERRLTLRRSSSWTTAETRRRLRARWSASQSWRSRLESPSWWRRALWSLSMSQVR